MLRLCHTLLAIFPQNASVAEALGPAGRASVTLRRVLATDLGRLEDECGQRELLKETLRSLKSH